MAAWITANQRSNLMQNCDLPPPLKLFSGPDETFRSSISKICTTDDGKTAKNNSECKDCSGENEKVELLKALQLSQTRAREAERKIIVLSNEKDVLTNLLMQESLTLFAHRQWVRLTKFQVLKLQQKQHEEDHYAALCSGENSGDDHGCRVWSAAIVFCLAVAGVGFAYGCSCLS